MKHLETGEHAVPLTRSMVQALNDLRACSPTPHFVPHPITAVALLNRGWIIKAVVGEQVTARSLYYITRAGLLALRIGKRAPGARETA